MNKSTQPSAPPSPAFRPRARIMKTLGEELISSDTVAVIELVKNAYDAGATTVLLNFVEPLVKGSGEIEVIDNGCGMDISTVRGAWMEPATPSKRGVKIVGGRRVLGEKGIGRFAASRLAKSLELFTRAIGAETETHAYFDWSQFDDEEKFLDEVVVLIESGPPQQISATGSSKRLRALLQVDDSYDCTHGTALKLQQLTQTWTRSHFEELQRGLSRLVSPFATLSNFRIKIEAPGEFSDFSSDIAPPEAINFPHYSMQGSVDAMGFCEIELKMLATNHIERLGGRLTRTSAGWLFLDKQDTPLDPSNVAPQCGPITIALRVWDRDDLGNIVQKTGATISSIRHDLDAFAGINIYRDNFRVMPYGEPKNDWLRLDMRRVQNPTTRLSNNQIVGYVGITADGNPALQDQSNREGLRESEAFTDLQGIVLAILGKMEAMRKLGRKAIRKDPQTPMPKEGGLFKEVDLGSLRSHLNTKHPGDGLADKLIDEAEQRYAEQIEGIKEVVARYQGLATLGKLIDVVLHDGRQPLSKISSEALLGKEDIDEVEDGKPVDLAKLQKRFISIGVQGDAIKTVFRRIEPFAGRKRGRPKQLYLEEVIRTTFDVHETQIRQLNIVVTLPQTQTLVTVDAAEIQEVFLNLLSNSLFWLETVASTDRRISVEVNRQDDGGLEVFFADSGPGIPDALRASIFDPYFSNKPNGIGLGLTIAGEIVSDFYGGTLELLDQSRLGGAEFKITLKKRV